YHGATLSAARSGNGQFHLAYQSKTDQGLWYRFFDGTSFGPRQQIDSTSDWALQAATTLVGTDAVIFYNHVRTSSLAYDVQARAIRNGALTDPVLLDGQGGFKSYPAALEQTPSSWVQAPCAFGFTTDA